MDVYGSVRPSYLKMLNTIHHQGLRLALGALRTSQEELSLLAFYVTISDISVIYVTAQMRRRTEDVTYGRAPNAISQGSLTCPSYTDTGPLFFTVIPTHRPNKSPLRRAGDKDVCSTLTPGVLTGVQACRKRRLNGAVSQNSRIKMVVPCRCLDGHVKEPYDMSMVLRARP